MRMLRVPLRYLRLRGWGIGRGGRICCEESLFDRLEEHKIERVMHRVYHIINTRACVYVEMQLHLIPSYQDAMLSAQPESGQLSFPQTSILDQIYSKVSVLSLIHKVPRNYSETLTA
jgi:hypothetical protein